jgi:predicted transcriptional regulator
MRSKIKPSDLITSRILKICASGASNTRITHQASPNSMKVISYLLLIDEGFIEVVPEGARTVHRATPKGISAIGKFEGSNGEKDIHILTPNSL